MAKGICSIDACGEPVRNRGWCNRHYQRWLKYGDPTFLKRPQSYDGQECSVRGCRLPARAIGLCLPHRQRLRTRGTLDPVPVLTSTERFEAYVVRGAEDECWGWDGPISSQGYALLNARPDHGQLAHRFAHETFIGPIPLGFIVDHGCHNADLACHAGRKCLHRRCTNPAHIEATTLAENVRRSAQRRAVARR